MAEIAFHSDQPFPVQTGEDEYVLEVGGCESGRIEQFGTVESGQCDRSQKNQKTDTRGKANVH